MKKDFRNVLRGEVPAATQNTISVEVPSIPRKNRRQSPEQIQPEEQRESLRETEEPVEQEEILEEVVLEEEIEQEPSQQQQVENESYEERKQIIQQQVFQKDTPTLTYTPPRIRTGDPHKKFKFARRDINPASYRNSRKQANFEYANEVVHGWAKEFSNANQDNNNGCAITRSDLIEICMDTIFYDLAIDPIGYKSHDELRADIKNRMIQYEGIRMRKLDPWE